MCASEAGHTYPEGNTSQSERLEISPGCLHGTQHEAFFAGTDVVLPVAMERSHAEGNRRNMLLGPQNVWYRPCDHNTSLPNIMSPVIVRSFYLENDDPSFDPTLIPVGSHLISGHSNERRISSSLSDGDLHILKLW